MPSNTMMDDDSNPLHDILEFQAEKLRTAPGAARVSRLARTAKRIPASVLSDLEVLILQISDTELIGADLALAIIDIAYCDARIGDATDFAAAFRSRLQRYVRYPEFALATREELMKRVAWWRCAVGRALEIRTWPAIALAK
jgi:hypothetical protein